METMTAASAAPRDRWFALPFLIIGALGILPALYILGFMGYAVLDGRPLNLWTDALPRVVAFAASASVFSWGMTLFVGYLKAIRARPWARRPLLWRATMAYNALLALISVTLSGPVNPLLLWFGGLITLAAIAHRRAADDAELARVEAMDPL